MAINTQGLRTNVDGNVRILSRLRSIPMLCAFLFNWAVIFGAAAISYLYATNPWIYLFSLLMIASRQHALLILVHEGVHYRITSNARWNDTISDFFAAIPIFFDTKKYRTTHLQHHAHLNTDKDPDWTRKIASYQWQFPKPTTRILAYIPYYIGVIGVLEWLNTALLFSGIWPLRKSVMNRILYHGTILLTLWHFQLLSMYLYYWLVPYLFIFPIFQRARSIAEHFGLARSHELNSSRNIISPWYERFFLSPHNVNFHLTHHLFPSVPFYNLPQLEELLKMNDEYRLNLHENTSFILPSEKPVWRDLVMKH